MVIATMLLSVESDSTFSAYTMTIRFSELQFRCVGTSLNRYCTGKISDKLDLMTSYTDPCQDFSWGRKLESKIITR